MTAPRAAVVVSGESSRLSLLRSLETLGLEVTRLTQFEEAASALGARSYDLVITEVFLGSGRPLRDLMVSASVPRGGLGADTAPGFLRSLMRCEQGFVFNPFVANQVRAAVEQAVFPGRTSTKRATSVMPASGVKEVA